MSLSFPSDYKYRFVPIFGDTPRVRIIEFFIYTSSKSTSAVSTYISQISRILNLSKSSVKKIIEELLDENFLIEEKIETHAKNPQRNLRINKDNSIIWDLTKFYEKIS